MTFNWSEHFAKLQDGIDKMYEHNLIEMQAIGERARMLEDVRRVLDEVERVHGIEVDRETIIRGMK